MITQSQLRSQTSFRRGFTLVELLVVMSIIVILLTMTLLSVRFVREGDRVRGAASQVQSFLAGARDRAIYSKEPRGVRFFVSPENPRAVTTMAYIAPGGSWPPPENPQLVNLERFDVNNDGDVTDPVDQVFIVHGFQNPGWWSLKRRGLLVDGLRIRIPKGPTGNWYPIDTRLIDVTIAPKEDQYLLLQIPYADGGNPKEAVAHSQMTYEIELPTKLLAQEPSILPESVLIDLDGSRIPDSWRPQTGANNGNYSGYMDVVFSPRGNIIGDAAGAGVIHFYVCDAEDSVFLKEQFEATFASNHSSARPAFTSSSPFVPMDEIPASMWVSTGAYPVKDRRVVTVFTQTGAISIHEVNAYYSELAPGVSGDAADPTDFDNDGDFTEPDGLADDPFYFAELGKVAK